MVGERNKSTKLNFAISNFAGHFDSYEKHKVGWISPYCEVLFVPQNTLDLSLSHLYYLISSLEMVGSIVLKF